MHLSLADFHPVADGETPDTAVLQRAMDQIAAAGGGRLTLPAGRYRSGCLNLPSDFELHLEAGAVLIASQRLADYQAVQALSCAEKSHNVLLYALGQRNITISGTGRIDGDGEAWFAAERDEQGYRLPRADRPRIIVFEDCEQVTLTAFTIVQAPMWTVHLVSCRHVHIDHLTIDNAMTMPNTDALDIDSCEAVFVSNSYLSAADDAICIKTTHKPAALRRPARQIMITNCLLRSYSCAFKIGTETWDDVEDVTVTGCTIFDSNRGIGILSRDGGAMRRLLFSNLTFACHHAPPCHWGKADPLHISVRSRDPAITPGIVEQVQFSNVTGVAEGAINLHAAEPGWIRDVVISQLQMRQTVAPVAQGHYDVRPPCNPDSPTGMGLDNAYKLDPKTGEAFGVERYPGGLPGLFARGVENLQLHSLAIIRPEPLPPGWHPECVVQLPD
ncbi:MULTISPECIES: glycoside hydrolase family 28 protein [Pantoea]|uniref:glycoside hydrolase family 28 protein n=1 Tax=Pantoea TaxID=53335 RepID=UPI00077A3AC4|nr:MULTISPECIES: glycoside hydrolase family 28 protein [Pantoea]MBD8130246.1 glycoside hydrolase family 28 protein [Pantoea agglomerans]MCW0975838.1 glycoside hydrolase family 28 protein [Pantoea sp. JV6]MRT07166.1 glycoside hydrolase family 28 protein [Pantoea agglomerans]QXB60259.1 glycoside hydrolase family 28 protein [Pantoea agglomerans]